MGGGVIRMMLGSVLIRAVDVYSDCCGLMNGSAAFVSLFSLFAWGIQIVVEISFLGLQFPHTWHRGTLLGT